MKQDEMELIKSASIALKQLKDENKVLQDKVYSTDTAIKLAQSLYDCGSISIEAVFDKIAEFSIKPVEELEIIKKAADMQAKNSNTGSFRLVSEVVVERLTPEQEFELGLLRDN